MKKQSHAFTLIEVLVVVAIIALLVSFLFPVMGAARSLALKASCASNLRQVALVCQSYTIDNRGDLPQGNSANPGTFKFKIGTEVDRFMDDLSIPPDIWYCPALQQPKREPASWMQHISSPDWFAGDEFPIGYFYVGNPSPENMWKFVKPVPLNLNVVMGNIEFVFDFCSAIRPAPADGSQVEKWYVFPHRDQGHPEGANILLSDFSLEYRVKNDLTLGYKFIHPENMYW